jgi:hypothetical protein
VEIEVKRTRSVEVKVRSIVELVKSWILGLVLRFLGVLRDLVLSFRRKSDMALPQAFGG